MSTEVFDALTQFVKAFKDQLSSTCDVPPALINAAADAALRQLQGSLPPAQASHGSAMPGSQPAVHMRSPSPAHQPTLHPQIPRPPSTQPMPLQLPASGPPQQLQQAGSRPGSTSGVLIGRQSSQLNSSGGSRLLQAVFRHDCLSLGCLEASCLLCQHNPLRRCTLNLDRKYCVGDPLKAKCGATIRVEVINAATGEPANLSSWPGAVVQVCLLDGNLFDQKCAAARLTRPDGSLTPEELEACMLLMNKKKSLPLLADTTGTRSDPRGYVILPLKGHVAALTDLEATDSSEALLLGRKPPFRLLARVILPSSPAGGAPSVMDAVSEGFVVATRRTRTTSKVDIPSEDDHISRIEHMGKETVRKLSNLQAAAAQVNVSFEWDDLSAITRVGDLKRLVLAAEEDKLLKQKLQLILKLTKDKYEEASEQAKRAVVSDRRLRVFFSSPSLDPDQGGLIFLTRLGSADMDHPAAFALPVGQEAGMSSNPESSLLRQPLAPLDPAVSSLLARSVLLDQLAPAQRAAAQGLQARAVAAWWTAGHPGWGILEVDTNAFLESKGTNAVELHLRMAAQQQQQQQGGLPSAPSFAGGINARVSGGHNTASALPQPPPAVVPMFPPRALPLASSVGSARALVSQALDAYAQAPVQRSGSMGGGGPVKRAAGEFLLSPSTQGQLVTKVQARDAEKPISTVVTLTPVPSRSPRGLAASRGNNIAAALEGLKAAAASAGTAQGPNGATRMAPTYPASTPAMSLYHQQQQSQHLGAGAQGSFPLSAGALRHPSAGGAGISSPFSVTAPTAAHLPAAQRSGADHLPNPFASPAAVPALLSAAPQHTHHQAHHPQQQQPMISSFAAAPAYAAAAAAGAVMHHEEEPPLSAAFDLPDLPDQDESMGGIPAGGNSGHSLSWLPPTFGMADRLAAAAAAEGEAGPGSVNGPRNGPAAGAGLLGVVGNDQQGVLHELLPGQGSTGRAAYLGTGASPDEASGGRAHIGRPDVGSGSSSDRHQQQPNPPPSPPHGLLHNFSRVSAGRGGPGSNGLGGAGGGSSKSRTFSDSLKGSLGWSEGAGSMNGGMLTELAGPGSTHNQGGAGGALIWSGPLPSPVLLQGAGPASHGPLGSGSFPAFSGLASMLSIERALQELGDDQQQPVV